MQTRIHTTHIRKITNMDILKLFKKTFTATKCFHCQKGGDTLKKVPQRGIYGEIIKYFAYHPICLISIVCEPEKHDDKKLSMALHIFELIEKNENDDLVHRRKWFNIRKANTLCQRTHRINKIIKELKRS